MFSDSGDVFGEFVFKIYKFAGKNWWKNFDKLCTRRDDSIGQDVRYYQAAWALGGLKYIFGKGNRFLRSMNILELLHMRVESCGMYKISGRAIVVKQESGVRPFLEEVWVLSLDDLLYIRLKWTFRMFCLQYGINTPIEGFLLTM